MFKEEVEVVDVAPTEVGIKFIKRVMCSCCRFSSLCAKEGEVIHIPRGDFLVRKGDRIEIGIEEKKTVLASIIMFFIPVCVFVFSLFLFRVYGELLSFLLALTATSLYYLIIRGVLRKKGYYFQVRIIRKL